MTSFFTAAKDRLRKIMNSTKAQFNTLLRLAPYKKTTAGPISPPPPYSRPWSTHEANLTLHQCLSTSTPTRPALPNEIILQILEHPSRLILVNSVKKSAPDAQEPLLYGSDGPQHGDWRILATDPIPAQLIPKLRVLVYTLKSQDQGWSSYPEHHGTYDASWTWFQAGLTRFEGQIPRIEGPRESELRGKKEQDRYELQRNRHAGREPEDYRIELHRDHELLRCVEEGDRFALWARAMFSGWTNRVHYARIDVWCVDDLAKGREAFRHRRQFGTERTLGGSSR